MRVARIKKILVGYGTKKEFVNYQVQFFNWRKFCMCTYIGEYSNFKTEKDAKRFINLLLAVGRSINSQKSKNKKETKTIISYIKYP